MSVTVESYIAKAPDEARAMVQELRAIVQRVAPDAVEVISYGIPTFKLFGGLVAIGVAKNHCGFYVMSATALEPFEEELKGYDTSKGTLRLKFGEPVPVELIEKLVRMRVTENEAGAVQKI